MKKKSSSVKRKNLKNSIFSPQIKNKRIKKIYQRFEFLIKQKEFKGYLVAVSGGADSLALAYLSKCYQIKNCLLYTSPSPRDAIPSRMPSSA